MRPKAALGAVLISVITIFAVAGAGCIGGGDEDAVYWLQIAPGDQKAQLNGGIVQAGIAWEPFVSDAVLDGTAHLWSWSSDIWPGHPCCVVAVDKDFLADNEELVLRFLKADMEATDWITQTLEEPDSDNYTMMLEMGAAFSQRNTTVVENSFLHMTLQYEITDEFLDGLETITQKYIDLGLVDAGKVQERGYSDIEHFVSSYVNSSLLTQAAEVEPSDTVLNPDNPIRVGFLAGDIHQFARYVALNTTVGGGMSLFEKYGVRVVDAAGAPYVAGGYVMDNLKLGTADIGYVGSPPAVLKHLNEGINTVIIAQANSEGSGIFVHPSITSFDDFRGKTIATPGPTSIQHLIMLDYFAQNGIPVKAR